MLYLNIVADVLLTVFALTVALTALGLGAAGLFRYLAAEPDARARELQNAKLFAEDCFFAAYAAAAAARRSFYRHATVSYDPLDRAHRPIPVLSTRTGQLMYVYLFRDPRKSKGRGPRLQARLAAFFWKHHADQSSAELHRLLRAWGFGPGVITVSGAVGPVNDRECLTAFRLELDAAQGTYRMDGKGGEELISRTQIRLGSADLQNLLDPLIGRARPSAAATAARETP